MQLEQYADGQHQRTEKKQNDPTALPFVAQAHVGLEEREKHRQKAELDAVRVCGDVDGFVSLKLSIRVEGFVNDARASLRGALSHVRENHVIRFFVIV